MNCEMILPNETKLVTTLREILNYAESEESKLDLLTSIGLDSGSDEVFHATETLRGEIASQSPEPRRYVEPRSKNKIMQRPESKEVLDCKVGENE